MSKTLVIPASIKQRFKVLAAERNYPVVLDIISRGEDDELIVSCREEAQAFMNVARLEMLEASLRYPYWDEDGPKYEPSHEEAFQDIQMGVFEKVAMYIGQEFEVVTAI